MAVSERNRWLWLAAAVALLLLAGWARFHLLGAQSLWHDEGNAYVQATRSFGDIAANAARDIHPPGYYWLLAVWRIFTGDSEFALRALSAFASLLTVALVYALGMRLYGRAPALAAALFATLNTFSIYYAQEARMYALLGLWSAASMLALVGLVQSVMRQDQGSPLFQRNQPALRWLVALGVFNGAGLWTHYAFPLVMIAQGMLALLWVVGTVTTRHDEVPGISWSFNYKAVRLMVYFSAASLLAIALFLPWLPTAWRQVTTWPNTGIESGAGQALPVILARLTFGITITSGTSITAAFFLLFGLLTLPGSRPREGWRMLVPVVWGIVPVGLFLALGLYRDANLKFLIPAQLAVALWLGRGVWVLWTLKVRRDTPLTRLIPRLAAGVGMLSIVSGLWSGLNPLYHDTTYRRDDYRAIVEVITMRARPGDAIILSAPNQEEVFGYYYDGDLPVYALPRGLGGDDAATLDELNAIIDQHSRIFAVLWGTSERDPNNIVEGTLDAQTFEADDTWYGDVRLARYASPAVFPAAQESGAHFGDAITLQSYTISAQRVAPGDVLQLQLIWTTSQVLTTRYKIFVHLVNPEGIIVAQRDAEPGGNQAITTTWTPGQPVTDNHALIIPGDLSPAHYSLIIGVYNLENSLDRLALPDGADTLQLAQITVE